MVTLSLGDTPGWRRFRAASGATLWVKGYLYGEKFDSLAARFDAAPAEEITKIVGSLDGHFALVWQGATITVAAVDPIASIPLCYRVDGDGSVAISSSAGRLLASSDSVSDTSALTVAMAGFTIGDATLYPAIKPIGCGKLLTVEPGNDPRIMRYHRYLPKPMGETGPALQQQLRDLTLEIIAKMAGEIQRRPIIVPLSAGLDSRLIVSALKEVGYDNVICISYGRAGNYEARAARKIAHQLGYSWHFIEHSPTQQAATFASRECQDFIRFADSFQAIPFQQDFHAVGTAKKRGIATEDAVFINGQSGDFIAGNHIPRSLVPPSSASIFEATVAKHFGMWDCLKTAENLAVIQALFETDCADYYDQASKTPADFAVYEASEYYNRQSKYVVAGQRTYEWFGYDWRLPLWDRAYIDFWESAPLDAKLGESLYRDMLTEANWGGVWGAEWQFKQTVVPIWMRPVRLAAKAAHAFKGREAWHRFEKNWIAWVTDPVANYAIAPYRTVRQDKRGHRNAISWHVERYLSDKGIDIRADGTLGGL